MIGLGGSPRGGTERVHTLAEATQRLTVEVRRAREAYERHGGKMEFGDGGREVARALLMAVDRCAAELRVTNQRLTELRNHPVVGFLGGGAAQELERLVDAANDLVTAVRELTGKVKL